MINYYERLEVAESATSQEIKKAFRRLAKKYHPDMNPDKDTTDVFIALEVAYSCLSNHHSRVAYDRLLKFEREKINNPALNRKYAQTVRRKTRKTSQRARYHSNLSYKQYQRDEFFRGGYRAAYIKGIIAVIIAITFFWLVSISADQYTGSNRPGRFSAPLIILLVMPLPVFIGLSYLYEPLVKYFFVGRPKRKKEK